MDYLYTNYTVENVHNPHTNLIMPTTTFVGMTSNSFSVTVGETDKVFSFNFKVENIKILPGTYDVSVSSKLLSRFTNKNQDLVYYIALEPDSTFE